MVVTKNTQKAAAELFGMNSSGSFILYSVDADEIDDHPFSVLDDCSKPYVRVFDEVMLELVLRELDTSPDFIKYLKVKEDRRRHSSSTYSSYHGRRGIAGRLHEARWPDD